MDIHHRFKTSHLPGDKMDFVYIDEVQDLNMRQILLFRYICNNVDGGFAFSGDTAQTIARGVDFRFEDIRSLFYNEFLMKSRDCKVSGSRGKGLVSDTYCLSQNFRTHTGVLNLAQSVIDLICRYFPQSIDLLAPETSRVLGEPPVVLIPGCNENSIVSMFAQGVEECSGWVGFGADQVILVRDDSARKEVLSYIDNQALILTFVECKGLEFQDVFLYNFFGSSPMHDQWRVVYEFLRENDLHSDGGLPKSFPSFCESRHHILCSELKQLYVAITRTRQRLWICENNGEVFQPMLDYWLSLGLVEVRDIDDSLVKSMQRASTTDDWKSQGIKLFWERNYDMAELCFKKAGEKTWEKRTKASRLRADMRLVEAAEIFYSINLFESAAECYCDVGFYEKAGWIYLERFSVPELRKAGECFSLARNYKKAAEVFAKGEFFRECLSACKEGNYFDMALRYVEMLKKQALSKGTIAVSIQEINKVEQDFMEKKALECYKSKDNASLLNCVRAFHSMGSRRKFLKSLGCLEELLVLEEEAGNFNMAAEIARSIGNVPREIDLLEKAERFADACMLRLSLVASRSLWGSGNRGWPLKSFPEMEALLYRAMSISKKVSRKFHASICVEAEVLSPKKRNLSELFHSFVASKTHESLTGEILSVRKLLDSHFESKPCNYELDSVLNLDSKSFGDLLSRNQISVGSLVFVWNLWKVHSLRILECLDSNKMFNFVKSNNTVQFCFNYFGITKLLHKAAYHMMNPDAAWANNVCKNLTSIRKVATLKAHDFAHVAREFWHEEFISVGLRVLDFLQEVYKSCDRSKFSQSMCLLHIFDIAKFFIGPDSVKLNGLVAFKVQGFLKLSSKFLDFVFPLDFRLCSSESMVALRESELSRTLLVEIFCRNVRERSELSYGQIGQAVMILLGYGKPNCGLLNKIAERLREGSSWKSFIQNLRMTNVSNWRCSTETLACGLHEALEETYKADWRSSDPISPNCFVYLVDRLLVLQPHSGGFFFTSKSSFVEYLICLPSDTNPASSLFTVNKSSSPAASIVEFVLGVVDHYLVKFEEMSERIRISGIDSSDYVPLLMLKLVMILCLLCLNWDVPLDTLYEKLAALHIREQLPREFDKALQCSQKNDSPFSAAVAEAFAVIGDPLVIVASSENGLNPAHPGSIFLNLTCRDESMKKLLSTSTAVHDEPSMISANSQDSSGVNAGL